MVFAHAVAGSEVWRFHPHPDVWVVLGGVVGLYFLALRRYRFDPSTGATRAVTPAQMAAFLIGMAVLWLGADWPVHDVSENYLFSVHMVQHTLFSLVAPPLLLLGMPAWLLRDVLRPMLRVVRFATRPVIAFVIFNSVIVVTHWPTMVNASVRSEPLHLALHLVLVGSALLMWWPVMDPLPELRRLQPPGKMVYLFLQSILPTVPASFLTFANTPIYAAYADAPRLWGISAVTDQMVAGLIMKIVGGLLLWLAIAIVFFKWHAAEQNPAPQAMQWDDFERELEVWDLRR
jgi:putative membrane protein